MALGEIFSCGTLRVVPSGQDPSCALASRSLPYNKEGFCLLWTPYCLLWPFNGHHKCYEWYNNNISYVHFQGYSKLLRVPRSFGLLRRGLLVYVCLISTSDLLSDQASVIVVLNIWQLFTEVEVNSTWLIASELANQRARKVVFTVVV